MDNVQKSFIQFHALRIKRLLSDYEKRKITPEQLFSAIQNHTNLILDETLPKGSIN